MQGLFLSFCVCECQTCIVLYWHSAQFARVHVNYSTTVIFFLQFIRLLRLMPPCRWKNPEARAGGRSHGTTSRLCQASIVILLTVLFFTWKQICSSSSSSSFFFLFLSFAFSSFFSISFFFICIEPRFCMTCRFNTYDMALTQR